MFIELRINWLDTKLKITDNEYACIKLKSTHMTGRLIELILKTRPEMMHTKHCVPVLEKLECFLDPQALHLAKLEMI